MKEERRYDAEAAKLFEAETRSTWTRAAIILAGAIAGGLALLSPSREAIGALLVLTLLFGPGTIRTTWFPGRRRAQYGPYRGMICFLLNYATCALQGVVWIVTALAFGRI